MGVSLSRVLIRCYCSSLVIVTVAIENSSPVAAIPTLPVFIYLLDYPLVKDIQMVEMESSFAHVESSMAIIAHVRM
jgi:hypothetical protein